MMKVQKKKVQRIEKTKTLINGIPAIIWGSTSWKVYLYIHGQNGFKEEAEAFAIRACSCGWQVLSIDLPGHGERKGGDNSCYPWQAVPELDSIYQFMKQRWERISLFANSMGAWFGMLCLAEKEIENCLFVSPVLDMERLIADMMSWAKVTEVQLEKKKRIPTSFGQTLSWEYWQYAKRNPIQTWNVPTRILYAGKDNMIRRETIEQFAARFHCEVTIMENGEHWFHTEEQLRVLYDWMEECLRNRNEKIK